MAKDHEDDHNKKPPQERSHFSKETIEQARNVILHDVGYKHPPQHTPFRKGQSGNPGGRPKAFDLGLGSDRSANTIALNEAERLISMREGAETREMPAIEAVFRKQIATALKGNAYAQKHVIERHHWAERESREQRLRSIEFWKEYIEEKREEINQAKERKEAPPSPLPHPDDIVIDYRRGVQFKGPINEEELARLQAAIKMRDVLIMQDALDQREAGEPKGDDPDDRPGTAIVYAMLINRNLPERFKLSDNELLLRTMRYDAMPKRVLLKDLYRAWREAGVPRRRGYTFPPLRVGKQAFYWVMDACEHFRKGGDLDGVPLLGRPQ